MFKNYLNILSFKNYDDQKEKISQENRQGIVLILLFYSVIIVLNIVWHIISHSNFLTNKSFVLEFVYMVIAVPIYIFVLKNKNINFTVLIYLFEIPLILITILHGTILDPQNLTFTFLFVLLVMPLLILDRPWRIILMTLSMTAIYLVMDYLCKDVHLFLRDLIHTLNACLISIAATLYTLTTRIENINLEYRLEEIAEKDSLTGLYNRFGARVRLKTSQPGLMIYMDLDGFKEVNDEFGHAEGDYVLQKTADVLRSCFRKDDVLIRMGGDEFVMFMPGVWNQKQIEAKMSELAKKMKSIHLHNDQKDIKVTVSIGCAYSQDGNVSFEDLMKKADKEMYKIKKNGKDNFKIVRM